MADRFSSINKDLVCLFLVLCVFLISACAPPNAGAIPAYLPGCPSPGTDRNPYFSHPQSTSIAYIFANYRNNNNFQIAKQHALLQLGKNLKHWSSYQNIVGDNSTVVRVVISYLDPALIQYIVLNYVLSWPMERLNATDINIFNEKVREKTNKIIQRDELLFVVTIVASSNNGQPLFVNLPIDKLALINPSNRKTLPTHFDHHLAEKIDVSKGPVFGIVSYPVSVKVGENCVGFIDQFTTSLAFDLEAPVTLGDKPYDSLYWNIPYEPLITGDDNYVTPIYDPSYDSRFSEIEKPPTPYLAGAGPNDTDSTYYWEEMGRYFWGVLVGESDH